MSRPAKAGLRGAPLSLDVGLAWLLRLRWGAALGEAAAILLAHFVLHIHLPLGPMLGLVGVTVVTCVVFARRAGSASSRLVGGLLVLDVMTLTGLLLLSGGASNPFTALYFVYVTLAAVLLGSAWAWAVLVLSVAAFGSLFAGAVPVPALGGHHHHGGGASAGGFSVHLYGMFVAFALAAGLIAYFVTRLSSALRAREAELRRVRERALASEKLAALTTLSAGAAHELGTPLGTIAVVAKELERHLDVPGGPPAAVEDARLIRTEVTRCRRILDSMSARAGEEVGELPEVVRTGELLAVLRERLGADAGRLVVAAAPESLRVPPRAFVQMLANVVSNGLQASDEPVEVVFGRARGTVTIAVRDRGRGMTPEVRARATEPFFTTKEAGEGMGLGLFLAESVVARLGGRMDIDSETGRGTTVTFTLPEAP